MLQLLVHNRFQHPDVRVHTQQGEDEAAGMSARLFGVPIVDHIATGSPSVTGAEVRGASPSISNNISPSIV